MHKKRVINQLKVKSSLFLCPKSHNATKIDPLFSNIKNIPRSSSLFFYIKTQPKNLLWQEAPKANICWKPQKIDLQTKHRKHIEVLRTIKARESFRSLWTNIMAMWSTLRNPFLEDIAYGFTQCWCSHSLKKKKKKTSFEFICAQFQTKKLKRLKAAEPPKFFSSYRIKILTESPEKYCNFRSKR